MGWVYSRMLLKCFLTYFREVDKLHLDECHVMCRRSLENCVLQANSNGTYRSLTLFYISCGMSCNGVNWAVPLDTYNTITRKMQCIQLLITGVSTATLHCNSSCPLYILSPIHCLHCPSLSALHTLRTSYLHYTSYPRFGLMSIYVRISVFFLFTSSV